RDFHVTGVQTCALPISGEMRPGMVLGNSRWLTRGRQGRVQSPKSKVQSLGEGGVQSPKSKVQSPGVRLWRYGRAPFFSLPSLWQIGRASCRERVYMRDV